MDEIDNLFRFYQYNEYNNIILFLLKNNNFMST